MKKKIDTGDLAQIAQRPLAVAEKGILHYLELGWVLIRSYNTHECFEGAYLQRHQEFDCYVPAHAFKSLIARGIIEDKGQHYGLVKDWKNKLPNSQQKKKR